MRDNELIIKNIIKKIENLDYVFVKLRESFPRLNNGEDIDIFTTQRKPLFENILSVLQEEIIDESITIKILNRKSKDVITLIKNYKILLKFEIYFSFSELRNLSVKDSIISNIVYQFNTKYLDKELIYKVPNDIYECLIRYIDFSENFFYHPDKKRHLDYLDKLIKEKKVNEDEFFKKLYYFVSFSNNYNNSEKNFFLKKYDSAINLIEVVTSYYKNNGFISLIKKIISKL